MLQTRLMVVVTAAIAFLPSPAVNALDSPTVTRQLSEEERWEPIRREARRKVAQVRDEETRKLLCRRIEGRFVSNNAEFRAVIAALGRATDVSLTADWQALRDFGTDDTTPLSFALDPGRTLAEALVVTFWSATGDMASVGFDARDGAVVAVLSTPDLDEEGH